MIALFAHAAHVSMAEFTDDVFEYRVVFTYM